MMKFLSFLRCDEEKSISTEMVQRLVKDLPPKFLKDPGKQLSVNKITRSLERVYQIAMARLQGSRLGFYRRSVLANTFKWGLKESGYGDDFIDIAVEGILVELTKSSKDQK